MNLKPSNGNCCWCGRSDLARNHILPRSVLRAVEKVQGPQHLRQCVIPNRVVQDLSWKRFLCHGCDNTFSVSEGYFIDRIYSKLLSGHKGPFAYDDFLLKYAISIAWKCLLTQVDRLSLTASFHALAVDALSAWEGYLRYGGDPGTYEHHILLSQTFDRAQLPEKYWNLMQGGFDCAVIDHETDQLFVITMFPGVVLLSSIHPRNFSEWSGTMIQTSGVLDGQQTVAGQTLFMFLNSLLIEGSESASKISEAQWQKIYAEGNRIDGAN